MRLEHGEVAVALVRLASGEAVIEDASQRVQVAAAVEWAALDLLRRAVVDSAEERARQRRSLRAGALGEAEVAEVRVVARLGDEDVRRLDVAMDEPRSVGGVERTADLLGDHERVGRRQRPALLDQRLEARTAHVAHREVEDPIDLVRVIDRDRVRMVERGGQLGLAEEAGAEGLVERELRGDHLQRDLSPEPVVRRDVHRPHAAAAEERLDRVPAERLAGSESRPLSHVGRHVRSR